MMVVKQLAVCREFSSWDTLIVYSFRRKKLIGGKDCIIYMDFIYFAYLKRYRVNLVFNFLHTDNCIDSSNSFEIFTTLSWRNIYMTHNRAIRFVRIKTGFPASETRLKFSCFFLLLCCQERQRMWSLYPVISLDKARRRYLTYFYLIYNSLLIKWQSY